MNKILILLAVLLTAPVCIRAQDAATEEQLNQLRGKITDLQASNVDLQKRLAEVQRELQELRTQLATPAASASAEDLKRLADAIKEVDRKREADLELVLNELKKLAKAGTERRPPAATDNSGSTGTHGNRPEKGYEYVVQSGDTLSAIVAEYRKQGVKVGVDDVLKANPGLKATNLKVGQKIFIPSPAQ